MTEEQINEIADELDSGFKCYVHKENGTFIAVPDDDRFPDMEMDVWEKEMEQLNSDPSAYIEIEPMDSVESFKVMEDFVNTGQ